MTPQLREARVRISALGVALALAACGNKSGEPVRSVAQPPLVVAPPVEAGASAVPPEGAGKNDVEPAVSGIPAPSATPPPLPATTRLAKGTGSAADNALEAADQAFDKDDFAVAEAKYREAASLAPKDPAPLVGLARVAIAKTNVATDYNAAPKHPAIETAATQLRQALRLDARFAPAHTELGRALLMLGKASEALAAARKAIELAPRDPEAHSALGVGLLATGRAEEAVTELAKAAEIDPGSAPRQTNLGTALLMRGRVQDAIRAYEAASRIAPSDARTASDLGTALLADNQVDRAISVLKRAVSLDPNRAALHSNLGYAYQQKRNLDGAIVEYREAIRLDAKLVSAWINLATALAQSGDRVEARKALERAQKIDPSDPRVRANFDELKDLDKKSAAGGSRERDGGK